MMKRSQILSLLLLVCLPFAQSCSEASAAKMIQGKPKTVKPDATWTGKIGQWGVVDNGSIYVEVVGTNMKGEDGSVWVMAMPAKNSSTGLAFKTLSIILHYEGVITIEGKKRNSSDGSSAAKAMDLLKIGKFTPLEKKRRK